MFLDTTLESAQVLLSFFSHGVNLTHLVIAVVVVVSVFKTSSLSQKGSLHFVPLNTDSSGKLVKL